MPRFDFYLHDLSFQYQEGIALEELHSRIEHLASDCAFIRAAEEQIFRCDTIYEVPLFEAYTIMDVIWPNTEILNRDHRLFLQIIIDHSTASTFTAEEIIGLLPLHDVEVVNGLLCLHTIEEGVPQAHIVYSENDWRTFHRHFLRLYPMEPEYFLQECTKCFPKLYLHERNRDALQTFSGGLSSFAGQVVSALAALNDLLCDHLNLGNIPGSLRNFSSRCGFETTNEGNIARRPMLTFNFRDRFGNEEAICCEPHIKLNKSDRPGDNTYHHYRIYFHFGRENIAEGRILVGHIGEHL